MSGRVKLAVPGLLRIATAKTYVEPLCRFTSVLIGVASGLSTLTPLVMVGLLRTGASAAIRAFTKPTAWAKAGKLKTPSSLTSLRPSASNWDTKYISPCEPWISDIHTSARSWEAVGTAPLEIGTASMAFQMILPVPDMAIQVLRLSRPLATISNRPSYEATG